MKRFLTGLAVVAVLVLAGRAQAAGNVVFTFTPNANEALDDNTQGKVRVFFRMFKYGQ